jgi:uncharacterized protein (DUF2132 family)
MEKKGWGSALKFKGRRKNRTDWAEEKVHVYYIETVNQGKGKILPIHRCRGEATQSAEVKSSRLSELDARLEWPKLKENSQKQNFGQGHYTVELAV